MDILSVSFREINLKREDIQNATITKITNNINIADLKEGPVINNEKTLSLTFEYTSKYETKAKGNLGHIKIIGDVLFTDKKKVLSSLLKSWKEKKLEQKSLILPLQAALNSVNIEAICLSKKVLLPSPINLPTIKPKE